MRRSKLEKEKVMVSVCCSTYNHAKFIKSAIDGFLMQKTNFIFEVIIHDDASTDGTTEIIKEYAEKYPNIIKPICQEINQFGDLMRAGEVYGYAPITKFIFPKAVGKYLALCEGDDYWTDSSKLQKQVDFLEHNPDYVYTYHASNFLLEDGSTVPFCAKGKDFSESELVELPAGIATSTKLFRNLYSEKTKKDFENFDGDAFLTCYLGLYGKCKFIDGISPSMYRLHSGGLWTGGTHEIKKRKYHDMRRKLYDLFLEKGIPEYIEIRKRASGVVNYFGIIITTYQRPDGKTPSYLRRTLDSVFAQTYKDFRVYLIGDRYDNEEELKQIISEYPKDKIFWVNLEHAIEREKYTDKIVLWTCGGTNATNVGIGKVLEEGLRFVCLLDHDDYWEPNHLEVINSVIEKEKASWVCTKTFIGKLRPDTIYLPELITDKEYVEFLPLPKHVVKASVCFDAEQFNTRIRNVYEESGNPFPGDADLWDRLAWHIKKYNLKSFMINKFTCTHDTERYILGNF